MRVYVRGDSMDSGFHEPSTAAEQELTGLFSILYSNRLVPILPNPEVVQSSLVFVHTACDIHNWAFWFLHWFSASNSDKVSLIIIVFQYSCRKLFPCDILGNQCMANPTRRHCKWKDSELTSYSNISLGSRKPCMDIPNIPVVEFRLQLWPIENKSIVHNWKNLFVRWWVVIIDPLVCINDWLRWVSF